MISCGLGGVQTVLILLAEIDGVGECHKEDSSKRGDERKSSTLMNVPSMGMTDIRAMQMPPALTTKVRNKQDENY